MKVVINYLRRLQNGANPERVEAGICVNLNNKEYKCLGFENIRIFVGHIAQGWKGFSGDVTYPVTSCDDSPMDAYYNNDNLWIGKYGEDRRDLCGFIADRLEAEL